MHRMNEWGEKVIEWRKTYCVNINQKKAAVSTLISDKDVRGRRIFRDKEGDYKMIKKSLL